ncbi:hypothetical protein V8C35DRAFT_326248 [Trichoderma chlorosporum]
MVSCSVTFKISWNARVISTATIIGILVITLPTIQSLSTISLLNKPTPTSDNSEVEADHTIYNPGNNIFQKTSALDKRSNFPFQFLERHNIKSLDSAANEAMFHSIHCLKMLRATMQSYFGLAPGNGHGTHIHGGRDSVALKVDERTHVEHYLGYIGRALLYNGDNTLEPPFTKYDSNHNIVLSAVNGQGHQHSCRDSTLAWKTVFASEEKPVDPFDWSPRDTVQSIFRRK